MPCDVAGHSKGRVVVRARRRQTQAMQGFAGPPSHCSCTSFPPSPTSNVLFSSKRRRSFLTDLVCELSSRRSNCPSLIRPSYCALTRGPTETVSRTTTLRRRIKYKKKKKKTFVFSADDDGNLPWANRHGPGDGQRRLRIPGIITSRYRHRCLTPCNVSICRCSSESLSTANAVPVYTTNRYLVDSTAAALVAAHMDLGEVSLRPSLCPRPSLRCSDEPAFPSRSYRAPLSV